GRVLGAGPGQQPGHEGDAGPVRRSVAGDERAHGTVPGARADAVHQLQPAARGPAVHDLGGRGQGGPRDPGRGLHRRRPLLRGLAQGQPGGSATDHTSLAAYCYARVTYFPVTTTGRSPMRRPLTLLAATAAATVAVAGIGVSAAPALASRSAPADQIINLTFPVTGSKFIKKINSSISLGPRTLASSADLTT